MADEDRNQKDKERENNRFYEAMPGTMRGMRHEAAVPEAMAGTRMDWLQTSSLIAGLALLFATLAGWWSALQSNGQILGIFAFNGWNTALALVAGILALYAAFAVPRAARVTWTILAVAYAFMFVVGLIVHGGQVIGLFANNYNDVWIYAILTAGFALLAASERRDVGGMP